VTRPQTAARCRPHSRVVLACFALAAALVVSMAADPPALAQTSLAPYVATPQPIVEAMLALAGVNATDVVYDLGSGDGRIVITAAVQFGARGVGFEIDERLISMARANARRRGAGDRAEFRHQDVMTVDLSPATVVTLFLGEHSNLTLRPKLQSELRSGARVVSHRYGMGDWVPAQSRLVFDEGGTTHWLYLWRIGSP
jgi:Methyltransferase domain